MAVGARRWTQVRQAREACNAANWKLVARETHIVEKTLLNLEFLMMAMYIGNYKHGCGTPMAMSVYSEVYDVFYVGFDRRQASSRVRFHEMRPTLLYHTSLRYR